jgi:large subunit ribosomal protein L35
MPKLKNHKGIAKRIKLSSTGKMLRRKAFRGHLLAGKAASRKRTC